MDFMEFDGLMRRFETATDHAVLPDMYMVVRLDGRSFTRLTKETLVLDSPFDIRFRDLMVDVTDYLISQAGFRVDYGWTGSDEISLLVNRNDQTFGRKERKIVSTLAGAASAAFTAMSCRLNDSRVSTIGCFDARVAQLPNAQRVVDYFRWRQADAQRNAINAHAYWALRRAGLNASQATRQLVGLSVATKLSLLGTFGVDFMQDVPVWHKNGVGLRWEMVDHTGHNPKTKQDVTTKRRRLCANYDLPDGAAYDAYVRERLL